MVMKNSDMMYIIVFRWKMIEIYHNDYNVLKYVCTLNVLKYDVMVQEEYLMRISLDFRMLKFWQ